MAKYITKEAALNTIFSELPEAHYPSRYAEKIKALPAADVVPVVRCKDCKHSYRIDGAKEEYDCAKISAFAKFFPGDHFCSYGERKTDG